MLSGQQQDAQRSHCSECAPMYCIGLGGTPNACTPQHTLQVVHARGVRAHGMQAPHAHVRSCGCVRWPLLRSQRLLRAVGGRMTRTHKHTQRSRSPHQNCARLGLHSAAHAA